MANALSSATPSSLAPSEYALHVPEVDQFFNGGLLIFGNIELATQNLAHWQLAQSDERYQMVCKEMLWGACRSCCARANNMHPSMSAQVL